MRPVANTPIININYEDQGLIYDFTGIQKRVIKCKQCNMLCWYPLDCSPEQIYKEHSALFHIHTRQSLTATEIIARQSASGVHGRI